VKKPLTSPFISIQSKEAYVKKPCGGFPVTYCWHLWHIQSTRRALQSNKKAQRAFSHRPRWNPIQSKEVYVLSKKTYIQSKKPYILPKDPPHIQSKEVYVLSKKTYILSKEPHIQSKKPYNLPQEPYIQSHKPYIQSTKAFWNVHLIWNAILSIILTSPTFRPKALQSAERAPLFGTCTLHRMIFYLSKVPDTLAGISRPS